MHHYFKILGEVIDEMTLDGLIFRTIDFEGFSLRRASIRKSCFEKVKFKSIQFKECDFENTIFVMCEFDQSVNWEGTKVFLSSFIGAKL